MIKAEGEAKIVQLTATSAPAVARLWRKCMPQEDACRWKTSGRMTTGETIRIRVLENPGFDPAGSFVALLHTLCRKFKAGGQSLWCLPQASRTRLRRSTPAQTSGQSTQLTLVWERKCQDDRR